MCDVKLVCRQFFSTYFPGFRNLHDQLKVPANYSRGQASLRSLAISGRYSRIRKRLRRIGIGNRRQRASPRRHQALRGDSCSARDRLLHADLLLPERLPVLRGHLQRGVRSSPSTQVKKDSNLCRQERQWKPVNVITLGQVQTNNIYRMKIITDLSFT